MVMLVTLEQASDHLRRDTTDDDADLTLKIEIASDAIIRAMGGVIEFDSAGEPVDLPDVIKGATLLTVEMLYNGLTDEWKLANVGLPEVVSNLMYMAGRVPTFA